MDPNSDSVVLHQAPNNNVFEKDDHLETEEEEKLPQGIHQRRAMAQEMSQKMQTSIRVNSAEILDLFDEISQERGFDRFERE